MSYISSLLPSLLLFTCSKLVSDEASRAVGIDTTPIPIKLMNEVNNYPPTVIGTISP